ncbi:hypothetical protein RQP46_001570 [Phenoliferia psychrophenolica]
MPLLTLHLIRLQASAPPLADFLARLQAAPGVKVVLASAPQHVVIEPRALDRATLLEQWDAVLLLETPTASLPTALQALVAAEYSVRCGIPSKLLAGYPAHNAVLRAQPPRVTGSLDKALSARDVRGGEKLELSEGLIALMKKMEAQPGGGGPVTMLNLLHFNEGGRPGYALYGQAFKGVAGRRGGDAKIVGSVVPPPPGGPQDARAGRGAGQWWDEISLVHYPSIRSFCDMLAGEDYQTINAKHRLGALKDTFLLCTTESLLPQLPVSAKL